MIPTGDTIPERSAAEIRAFTQSVTKEQKWCILITADPDAIASAFALRRIIRCRAKACDIYRTNEISRPDNLAMLRLLHMPIEIWRPECREGYTHFALVDSQPHHSPLFQDIPFSCVIDHHPLPAHAQENSQSSAYIDIRPGLGAASTILTIYLRYLRIRPTEHLATALLLGIRTDTAAFERSGGEIDLRAYQWLSRKADTALMRRIIRSEYLPAWLPLFSRAFNSLRVCRKHGRRVWIGKVDQADALVSIADFFTRVHGLRWVAVAGIVGKSVIVIFRGDGSRDIGRLADACFHDVGSAGGHRNLGRAEILLSAIPAGRTPEQFIAHRLEKRRLRPRPKTPAPKTEQASFSSPRQDNTPGEGNGTAPTP